MNGYIISCKIEVASTKSVKSLSEHNYLKHCVYVLLLNFKLIGYDLFSVHEPLERNPFLIHCLAWRVNHLNWCGASQILLHIKKHLTKWWWHFRNLQGSQNHKQLKNLKRMVIVKKNNSHNWCLLLSYVSLA